MEGEFTFLKMRIFGASDCDHCKMLQKSMQHHGLAFDFVDANDPKNERLCDFFDVDKLPLLQILDSRTSAVVAFHSGLIDPMKFLERTASALRGKAKTKDGAFNLAKIKKDRTHRGCSGCYD